LGEAERLGRLGVELLSNAQEMIALPREGRELRNLSISSRKQGGRSSGPAEERATVSFTMGFSMGFILALEYLSTLTVLRVSSKPALQ